MKVRIGKYLKNKLPRVNVEIEDYDAYSLDHTLALIILPALIDLKNAKQGVPVEFASVGGEYDSGPQVCFEFYNETYNEAFELGIKQWEEVLDKMIWSFQQLVEDDYHNQYHHGELKWDWAENKEEMFNPFTGQIEKSYSIIDLNPGEHWYDSEGHKLHEERIQEGLELFGKYYTSLWS